MRKLAQSQRSSSELCIFHGIWGDQPSQHQLPTGTVDGAEVAVQVVVCLINGKAVIAAAIYKIETGQYGGCGIVAPL